MIWTFAMGASLAAAIEVESGHTASIALASPQVELEGHGTRLQIPAGWRADMTGRFREAGHVIGPDATAELRLRPTVVASGCTERRGQVHCSAWVRWHLMVPGNDPVWETETRGEGPDPAEASRAAWLEAVDTLLGDPSFVQAVHYGPLGGYDCAFAGQIASIPVRISPEPEANRGYGTYDDDWNDGVELVLLFGSEEIWFLTGLGLLGTGIVITAAAEAAASRTGDTVELVLHGVAVVGLVHIALGASITGIKLTDNERGARIHLTGNGIGISGRF